MGGCMDVSRAGRGEHGEKNTYTMYKIDQITHDYPMDGGVLARNRLLNEVLKALGLDLSFSFGRSR